MLALAIPCIVAIVALILLIYNSTMQCERCGRRGPMASYGKRKGGGWRCYRCTHPPKAPPTPPPPKKDPPRLWLP